MFTGQLDLICYVDADFAGIFGNEDPRNADSARSRCGYVITLGGIPVYWKSMLLTAICLSTLEAEYQSLSLSMRQMIGFKLLLEELIAFFETSSLTAVIQARVFEDNQGALYLATNQRITDRTKYFHTKWHHFWSHVLQPEEDGHDDRYDEDHDQNDDDDDDKVATKIEVLKVDTSLQNADYFTKPLPRNVFEENRGRVQGW